MSIRAIQAVWDHSQQKGSHLLIMLALADYADEHGRSYPSIETLAQKTRLSVRWVQMMMEHLADTPEEHQRKVYAGETTKEIVIERNAGRGHANVYRLILPGLVAPEKVKPAPQKVKPAPQKVKPAPQKVKPASPDPSLTVIEPSIDPPPTPTSHPTPLATEQNGGGPSKDGSNEARTALRATIVREMGHEPLTPDESRAWAKALDNLLAANISPQQLAKAFKAARDRWSRAENITPPAIVRNLSSLLDNRTGAKRNQDRAQAAHAIKAAPPMPESPPDPPTPEELAAKAAYEARKAEQEAENRRQAEQIREQWRQQIANSEREKASQARASLGIATNGHMANCPCMQCQIKRREQQRQAMREGANHASL